ncbi:hypothetical protein MINT15_19400 [Saccharomonospora viridis]|uniref:Uncharacterized protein n=1 Tax=Saccharomonospora viridis TaxID=1852 RepID=A0A837DDM4_9PSEU|nr:hypothetical protein MINT15_19400 [Saccharomonospora viridis]
MHAKKLPRVGTNHPIGGVETPPRVFNAGDVTRSGWPVVGDEAPEDVHAPTVRDHRRTYGDGKDDERTRRRGSVHHRRSRSGCHR